MEGPQATSATQEQRVPAYSWYALAVLFLVYLLNFVDRQILSILANDIKGDLGLTDAELGFLYGTAFAIFYALFGIPLGRLADGWHRTRLLAAGLALWSLMTALSGLARTGAALAAARVGVGVGEATANPCAYSLIADWFPQRLRATALALYSSGLFVGSGLSLLIGGLVVQAWNSASSSCLSAGSNSRPPTRSTNVRASRLRPDRRGPARTVALTGHRFQRRKCSKASRLASDRMKRRLSVACGQSSGSAIWSVDFMACRRCCPPDLAARVVPADPD